MSIESVGRRYARAVFELAKESGKLDQVARDMDEFAKTLAEHAELSAVLDSPRVEDEAREAVVREVATRMSLDDLTARTLRLLAQRRRTRTVGDLARELRRLVDQDQGVLRAEVTSAAPLSASFVERLRTQLEKSTGRKVTVTTSVDPSLVAGVVTRIGDRVIDGSVRTRLRGLRDTLGA